MTALWQQGRGATLVRFYRYDLEKECLRRSPLVEQGERMAYYKLLIHVWCDWDPSDSDLEEIGRQVVQGDAICTLREVVTVVDRPQDIEDEVAMRFFAEKKATPTSARAEHYPYGEISYAFR